MSDKYNYNKRTIRGTEIDIYDILDAWEITNPAQQHAIKKALRAGRSSKSLAQDANEVRVSVKRWCEMIEPPSAPGGTRVVKTGELVDMTAAKKLPGCGCQYMGYGRVVCERTTGHCPHESIFKK